MTTQIPTQYILHYFPFLTNCAISQRPIVTHVCMCMYVSEGSKRDISSTNEVADPHDLRRFMKLQKTWPTHADMLLGWMMGIR